MRTEPPSPRQPVLAGSASRHVITTWEKSAGDDSGAQADDGAAAPQTPRGLRAYLPWLPAHGSWSQPLTCLVATLGPSIAWSGRTT
jgi:hypothetical protein